jgi:hypothetical protein
LTLFSIIFPSKYPYFEKKPYFDGKLKPCNACIAMVSKIYGAFSPLYGAKKIKEK